jgi:hypothetical protein
MHPEQGRISTKDINEQKLSMPLRGTGYVTRIYTLHIGSMEIA